MFLLTWLNYKLQQFPNSVSYLNEKSICVLSAFPSPSKSLGSSWQSAQGAPTPAQVGSTIPTHPVFLLSLQLLHTL